MFELLLFVMKLDCVTVTDKTCTTQNHLSYFENPLE